MVLYVTESNPIECAVYRLFGLILLVASILCLIFNCNFLVRNVFFRSKQSSHLHHLPIVISMVCSSLVALMIIVPVVLYELFTCRTHSTTISNSTGIFKTQYGWMCMLQGFVCFSSGTFHMYTFAFLSFIRYARFQFNMYNFIVQMIDKRCVYIVSALCLMAIVWAVPPLFSVEFSYVFDGIGHCTLNWRNKAVNNRVFLLSTIVFIYIIPLILLLYFNIRVFIIIRTLPRKHTGCKLSYCNSRLTNNAALRLPFLLIRPSTPNARSAYLSDSQCAHVFQQRLADVLTTQQASRLRQLRIEHRYVCATAVVVFQYILAWTPYAIMAGYQLVGKETSFIFNIIAAYIAKMTLIFTPIIYLYSINIGRRQTIIRRMTEQY